MRALCVQNPWASLIADGVKTLEVRTWTTRYRGPIAIVASKAWSRHEAAAQWRQYRDAPTGVVLCVVELVNVRAGNARDASRTGGVDPTGAFVWELRNPRAVTPVTVRGQLGLYTPHFHIALAV